MAIAAWFGYTLFCLASVAVGARLLRLWARSRQAPELLAALALLGIGPLGFGLSIASIHLHGVAPGLGDATWAFAAAALTLGGSCVFLFTQQVFHPRSRFVRRLAWAAGGLFTGLLLAEAVTHGFPADEPAGPPMRAANWLRTAGLLWGAAAALRYRSQLVRRVALGIGDAGALARLLGWALALGAAGLASGIDASTKLLTDALELPWLKLVDAALGTVSAAFLWRAFRAEKPAPEVRAPSRSQPA